jgi:hypothetical protein
MSPELVKPNPAEFDARIRRAYSEIENEINEVLCMAIIAANLTSDADGKEATSLERELAAFAVYHVPEIARALKAKYYRQFEKARAA